MMGHSLKILGLASLNIFVALALAAAYLTQLGPSRLQTLTEEDITAFFYDLAKITDGKHTSLKHFTATRYFMDHVADDGVFKNNVKSSIPGIEERNITMDKKTFIGDKLKNMSGKGVHYISMKIEGIKIGKNGLTATVMTTSREGVSIQTGKPEDSGNADTPAVVISRCEQTVGLSNSRMIQVQSATCTTEIKPVNSL